MEFNPTLPWYHGSPLELAIIRSGSTITQKIDLARIFSHKPTIVSISDDGQIKHNGNKLGCLYVISETVGPTDVTPHPRTTMAPGDEWLTTRDLHIRLLYAVSVVPEEQFTEAELMELLKNLQEKNEK